MSFSKYNYPTIEAAEKASLTQLVTWRRFLPSPGLGSVGNDNFEETQTREARVLTVILDRIDELGGCTPEVSKLVGWDI